MARVNTLGFYPTVESILIRHPIITSTYGYRTQICTLADGWATLYVFEFGNNSFVLDKLAIFDYGLSSKYGYRYGVHSTIDGMSYREKCLGGLRNAVCDIVGDTEEATNWLLEVGL